SSDLTSSGVKAHQVTNQQKFLERWREVLKSHPDPKKTTPADIAIARQHRARRHVLVIDATTPQPDHDSGSVRLVNILRLLLEDIGRASCRKEGRWRWQPSA